MANPNDSLLSSDAPAFADGDLEDYAHETRVVRPAAVDEPGGGPAGDIKVDALPANVRPRLEIVAGPNSGKVYIVNKPLLIIGRVPDVADIVLRDEATSRHHAAIGYRAGQFLLYDMGSSNGTFLAGEKVTAAPLRHGSEISVGNSIIIFWMS